MYGNVKDPAQSKIPENEEQIGERIPHNFQTYYKSHSSQDSVELVKDYVTDTWSRIESLEINP